METVDISGLTQHLIKDDEGNLLFLFEPNAYFETTPVGLLVQDIEKRKEVLNLTMLLQELGIELTQINILSVVYALLAGRDKGKYLNFA